MSHCQIDHGLAALGERFVVLAQAAVSSEPREGSLDDPTLGQNHEPRHVVAAFDDLQNPPAQFPRPFDQLARITTVGPDQLQPAETALERELNPRPLAVRPEELRSDPAYGPVGQVKVGSPSGKAPWAGRRTSGTIGTAWPMSSGSVSTMWSLYRSTDGR